MQEQLPTTAGQGLFRQSFCIPSIPGGQMQEVEQRMEQLPSTRLVQYPGYQSRRYD